MPQIVQVLDECQALFNYSREDSSAMDKYLDMVRDDLEKLNAKTKVPFESWRSMNTVWIMCKGR